MESFFAQNQHIYSDEKFYCKKQRFLECFLHCQPTNLSYQFKLFVQSLGKDDITAHGRVQVWLGGESAECLEIVFKENSAMPQ